MGSWACRTHFEQHASIGQHVWFLAKRWRFRVVWGLESRASSRAAEANLSASPPVDPFCVGTDDAVM